MITEPWPAMLRGIWGDMERYRDTYWSRFAEEGYYFAGDGAKWDSDGALWILGRVDDVMNISGHRISTSEVESALVGHDSVAEAAVVGADDATTGQAIVAYVILRERGRTPSPDSSRSCEHGVPRDRRSPSRATSRSCPSCPRPARKIMRHLLGTWPKAAGGDTSTLSDPTIMERSAPRARAADG